MKRTIEIAKPRSPGRDTWADFRLFTAPRLQCLPARARYARTLLQEIVVVYWSTTLGRHWGMIRVIGHFTRLGGLPAGWAALKLYCWMLTTDDVAGLQQVAAYCRRQAAQA